MDMSWSELREMVMDRVAWCAAIHGVAKSRTQLSDWTELMWDIPGPGIEPVSPALTDAFFTTEPPGVPHITTFYRINQLVQTYIK